MGALADITFVSLAIGLICTYILFLNDRRAFMKRETYKTLSAISFIFNMSGFVLCMFALVN